MKLMKLLYTETSPYSRKVRVALIEKGLMQDIELAQCNPLDEAAGVRQVNPLGKIPCLQLPDGAALYDSRVIVEYLDSLSAATSLIPADGAARWIVLRQQALGDGVMDAAVATVMERRRPQAQQSADWIDRWRLAIREAVRTVDREAATLEDGFHMGHITLACALGYLDFRLPELDWRAESPAVAAWFSGLAGRPSLIATRPLE